VCERLKVELRHSWLSDGSQESVAEHSWLMAMLALLTHNELEHPVDIHRTLEMVIVHDLIEALCGDVPYTADASTRRLKADRERSAMTSIRESLPAHVGDRIFGLWREYEDRRTREARFAKALDNLEVQMQHNLADLRTWDDVEYDLVYTKMDPHCAHDSFLRDLCAAVKSDAEDKWRRSGIDPAAIRARST
jgi:putative hydrolase of HD superfamily